MSVEGAAISLLLPAACGCLWELINLWQGNAPISQTEGIPHRAVGLSVLRLSIVLLRRHRFPIQFSTCSSAVEFTSRYQSRYSTFHSQK